jgi:hypothetical protein
VAFTPFAEKSALDAGNAGAEITALVSPPLAWRRVLTDDWIASIRAESRAVLVKNEACLQEKRMSVRRDVA